MHYLVIVLQTHKFQVIVHHLLLPLSHSLQCRSTCTCFHFDYLDCSTLLFRYHYHYNHDYLVQTAQLAADCQQDAMLQFIHQTLYFTLQRKVHPTKPWPLARGLLLVEQPALIYLQTLSLERFMGHQEFGHKDFRNGSAACKCASETMLPDHLGLSIY